MFLSYFQNDLDTSIFLKSFINKPRKNIIYLFKLLKFVATLSLNRLFTIFRLDFNKFKKIKYFYLISLSSRARYLKRIYFSNSIMSSSKVSDNWYIDLPILGWRPRKISNGFHSNNILKLASRNLEFKGNKIPWENSYKDPEDTMALHRFGWLLNILVDNQEKLNLNNLLDFIEDWIFYHKDKNKSIEWESYSVSERLVNWLLFLCAIKPHINIDDKRLSNIKNELLNHLKYLASNLEYRGEKTNNHIINNARALYIGGRLLNVKFAEKIAILIIKNETDRLLDNGVLNEGSTHYQLLVTKNYLEIIWVAHKTKDKDLINWLKFRIKNMLDVCNYFAIENKDQFEIPFIGDISPDSPPDWLIGYPFIYNKNKFSRWSKLWNDFSEFDRLLKDIIFIRNNNDLASMKKNQWLKIINSNSTTFSMVKNSAIKSHAHQDEGSFFYVYKKLPIIIDPGLKNYLKDDSISRSQLNANSHNVITINGIE